MLLENLGIALTLMFLCTMVHVIFMMGAGGGKKNGDKKEATVKGQYLTSDDDYKALITPEKTAPTP